MFGKKKFDKNYLALLSLRVGLAFSFFYVVVNSTLNPGAWIWFFPNFISSLIPQKILMTSFSILETIIGFWLLSNKKIFYVAILSALMMAGIVVFNLSAIDVVFRDITIFFAAIALAILSKNSA